MPSFTREYYLMTDAAELLGCKFDDLLHSGARGRLPVYIISKGWWGIIFDHGYMQEVNTDYSGPIERKYLSDLVQLWPGNLQFLEDGSEEITVDAILHSPNPVTGERRQVNLDVPVVINRTQLFVKSEEIQNLQVDAVPQGQALTPQKSKFGPPKGMRPKTLKCHKEWQRLADELKRVNPSLSKSDMALKIHFAMKGEFLPCKQEVSTIRQNIK